MTHATPPLTETSAQDVFGRVDQMVKTLEQIQDDRRSKRRTVNILKYRKIQTLKVAAEDLRRLMQQAKELTEPNPTCKQRYETTLDAMARDIFASCQSN